MVERFTSNLQIMKRPVVRVGLGAQLFAVVSAFTLRNIYARDIQMFDTSLAGLTWSSCMDCCLVLTVEWNGEGGDIVVGYSRDTRDPTYYRIRS